MDLPIKRIAVLVSCFNRKDTTLAGLKSLFNQTKIDDLSVTVYLVDDASPDGTAAAVAEKFPPVQLIHGNGSLWWAGGMRKAFATALAEGFDAYMWWNDDTELMEDALYRLVACSKDVEPVMGPAVIVGSVCDPLTGKRTYGGIYKRKSLFRIDFVLAEPNPDKPIRVDTMNGNCVLIPKVIADKVGNIEPTFVHKLGDFDYGQRVVMAGFPVVLAPGFFGAGKNNSVARTWQDGTISLAARWKDLMSSRGADPREWLLFTTRHYGWRWPLYFVSPYVKVLFKGFTAAK